MAGVLLAVKNGGKGNSWVVTAAAGRLHHGAHDLAGVRNPGDAGRKEGGLRGRRGNWSNRRIIA